MKPRDRYRATWVPACAGMTKSLTKRETHDLIAYVATLKAKP